MKTLNSIETEVVKDLDDNSNFIGIAEVYNEKIFINTKTGEGYEALVKKLSHMIDQFARKYVLPGSTIEDGRQNVVLCILEGVKKYDPTKSMKLSTFLQMRINRRLINEIRNLGTESRNATILRTSLYKVNCKCGNRFTITTTGDEKLSSKKCDQCGKNIDQEGGVFPINKEPGSLSESNVVPFKKESWSGEKGNLTVFDVISDSSYDIPLVYGQKTSLEDSVIAKHDLERCLENEDPRVQKLIKYICFDDCSVKVASEKVGISHTSANNKLKRLQKKKLLQLLSSK